MSGRGGSRAKAPPLGPGLGDVEGSSSAPGPVTSVTGSRDRANSVILAFKAIPATASLRTSARIIWDSSRFMREHGSLPVGWRFQLLGGGHAVPQTPCPLEPKIREVEEAMLEPSRPYVRTSQTAKKVCFFVFWTHLESGSVTIRLRCGCCRSVPRCRAARTQEPSRHWRAPSCRREGGHCSSRRSAPA